MWGYNWQDKIQFFLNSQNRINGYIKHTNKPITTKITIRNIYNFINKNLSFGLKTWADNKRKKNLEI